MRRGFLLSVDALVAMGLLLVMVVFISSLSLTYSSPELEYQRLYQVGRDSLNLIELAKIKDLTSYQIVQDYIDQGVIGQEDMNKSLLDTIGSLWSSGNTTRAANLAQEIFSSLLGNAGVGYEISIDNTTIYKTNTTARRYVAALSTLVSGYDVGEPVSGYVSRAYLSTVNKISPEYAYFGGFVGEGNLSRYMTLPQFDNITDVYFEVSAGSNFSLYINGNFSGSYSVTAPENLTADKFAVDSGYWDHFVAGQNLIQINFSSIQGAFISGGFLKVTYSTPELITEELFGANATGRYEFPGITGLINLFSSFYIPGPLQSLSMGIHYNSRLPVFLNIGNVTIFRGNATGDQNLTFNSTELAALLNYSHVSEKTIPLRFGTEEVDVFFEGNTDTTLITDRTGSMTQCDVDIDCGEPGICDSNPIGGCHQNRHSIALEADALFVSIILNTSGNSVGLIGYGERTNPTCSMYEVTSDNQSLQDRISDYNSGGSWQQCGYTCISCGIVGAALQLEENQLLYEFSKARDINTSFVHVGDDTSVSHNVTLNVPFTPARFIKSRLVLLGTNIDVEYGYKDCVYLNNHYLGRVCESNEVVSTGLHSCMYPVKPAWLTPGNNVVTITGGTLTGCLETAGEHDDWDFKDVELIVWEANSTAPTVTEFSFPQEEELNSDGSITYNFSAPDFLDLWELESDLPYPVDFTSGYNTTGNSFGLGGSDDGWDWSSGVYGFSGTCTFNGVVNEMLEMYAEGDDESCAYGIAFAVTQNFLNRLANESVYVSFDYVWDGNDDPFEDGDQVWIKGQITLPNGTSYWLGADMDTGHSGADGTPEIATADNPDDDFQEFFYQNITEWVTEIGWYYLDFGGKLDRNVANEWGYFRFDNVTAGIGNLTYPPTGNIVNVTFALDTNNTKSALLSFEALDVDPTYYDCVLVNDKYVGRLEFQQWSGDNEWQEVVFDVPVTWLANGSNTVTFAGGTPYGCLRTGDNDVWKFRDVNITVRKSEQMSEYDRVKTMLIMSDGDANTKIGDCYNYGSGLCTVVAGAETPSEETISTACEAYQQYGMRIFAVAFGNAGAQAIDTLNQTACCDDCSHFFTSNDAGELVTIYQNIADLILNLTTQTQQINITENVTLNETLFPDSYIEYLYTSTLTPPAYGEVTLTLESPRFGELTGSALITDNETGTKEAWYTVPNNTEVIEALVTSYSADLWTDRVYVKSESESNWTRVYWLGDYGGNYSNLGDPYCVAIPTARVKPGENNSIRLGTGFSPDNATGGSPDSKVIYTVRISGVTPEGYSGVFSKADGCNVTVFYDSDADNISDGSIDVVVGPNPADIFDPYNDSVDDSFMRLLDVLNFLFDANDMSYGNGTAGNPYDGINQTNPIDLQITSEVLFDIGTIGGIPTLWGPVKIDIRTWV